MASDLNDKEEEEGRRLCRRDHNLDEGGLHKGDGVLAAVKGGEGLGLGLDLGLGFRR